MTKNPFYNVGAGLIYITFVVFALNTGSRLANPGTGNNFLIPIGMLSLFVFSAAMMAYIFLYQPIIMFMEGNRQGAISLLWKTAAIFAGSILVIFLVALTLFK
jgi:hypothetical protein